MPADGRVSLNLDDPVSRHLHTDCTRLRVGQTVAAALEGLRRDPPGERIVYFYVVDDEGRLQGVVPTRHLLLNAPERLLADIMIPKVITLPATATVGEACELFALHRFLALPVVDEQRRLLGVIDVELYTREILELTDAEQRLSLFQRLGVYASRPSASPLAAFGRRFPWLGCNLSAGLVCALLASLFEVQLAKAIILSWFIPVVLNLAESVSSQSVSLTVHLLRSQRPTWRLFLTTVRQELATGLLLGIACGATVGAVALIWKGQVPLALTLLGGVGGGVAASALLGLLLPIGLRLLKLDPRVAAGPIALAAADVVTLLLYLGLASWLLG